MKTYIHIYIKTWFLVLLLDFLVPVKSVFLIESKVISLGISFIYILLSSITAVLYYQILLQNNSKLQAPQPNVVFNTNLIKRIIRTSALLSLIGLFCFGYDKANIQELDYSDGIAAARHQFIDNGVGRENSVSSIFSVLGYFLGGFSFIGLFFSLVFKEEIKKTHFFFYSLLSFISIIGVSVLTGGRTSIIIIITIFISSYIIRGYFGLKKWPFSRRSSLYVSLVILLLFVYNLYIFSERARTANKLSHLYMETMLYWMQGVEQKSIENINSLPVVGDFADFIIILWVYLTHSNWIFEGVIETSVRDGMATFNGFWVIFAKLKLLPALKEWAFTGRFICWPGGLYYDFGLIGMCFISVIHGLIAATYIFRVNISRSLTVFNLLMLLVIFSITITSPFIIVIDVLMFPPMTVSFLTLSFVLILLKLKLHSSNF